jgi:hypothetical protein
MTISCRPSALTCLESLLEQRFEVCFLKVHTLPDGILEMFRQSRPTQVPWKCDHCGAKYMVTLSGFLESTSATPPCIKCKQQMNFSSMRNAAEFDPLFDTSEPPNAK